MLLPVNVKITMTNLPNSKLVSTEIRENELFLSVKQLNEELTGIHRGVAKVECVDPRSNEHTFAHLPITVIVF